MALHGMILSQGIVEHWLWEWINRHEAIVMSQRALASWGKICVRAESVLYSFHSGNAYRHVGNTDLHVNFS